MVSTVSYGNLDALVGLSFGWNAFSAVTTTQINGSVTIDSASTEEVITYSDMTGSVTGAMIPLHSVTYQVASVNDATDSLVLDAYVNKTLVGQMNFTVAGFSGAGIALAAMPLDAFIQQAGNLSSLAGNVFVLGLNTNGAKGQSIDYPISTEFTFFPNSAAYYATAAQPVLTGTQGSQLLVGLSGNDTITAGVGKTVIYGSAGNDTLICGSGTDFIYAGAGTNTLIGGSGVDTMTAGNGVDTLIGGTGRSIMVGGYGQDTFVFSPGHTGGLTTATADSIQRFRAGTMDVINLTAFDAVLPAGSGGHLTFIGTQAFDGHAGEVRYDVTSTGLTITADLTGAGVPDFMITLKNVFSLTANDFVL